MSATLLVGRPGRHLDEYAQTYLAGNTGSLARTRSARGPRARPTASPPRTGPCATSCCSRGEGPRLSASTPRREAASFDALRRRCSRRCSTSLTLERPAFYARDAQRRLRLLAAPARLLAGDPPLHRRGHARSSSSRARPWPRTRAGRPSTPRSPSRSSRSPGTAASRPTTRRAGATLGESFSPRATRPGADGYLDVLRTETPLAMSQLKRFYKVASRARLLADPRGAGRRLPARGPMVRSDRRHLPGRTAR